MSQISTRLSDLFNQIPRRHSPENVKEIYQLLTDYEALLIQVEALNAYYEKITPVFFNQLEEVRAGIKKSTDPKASKKMKDHYFDEASGILKDSVQELMKVYGDGTHTS